MVFKLPSALDRPVHALFPPKQIYERYTIGFTLVPLFLVILPMEGHMCGSERQIFYIFMVQVPPFRHSSFIVCSIRGGATAAKHGPETLAAAAGLERGDDSWLECRAEGRSAQNAGA